MSVKLPPRFIQDCLKHGCDVGTYSKGHLTATPAQLAELRARAKHYARAHCPDPDGLKWAAQVLLEALNRNNSY